MHVFIRQVCMCGEEQILPFEGADYPAPVSRKTKRKVLLFVGFLFVPEPEYINVYLYQGYG
jgi:hypothetical protein